MKTYEHVYDILSKSPDFVTGESLAKSLGVSRTAIWKAIQTLQEQGIDITSVRKKGYYLEKGDILLPQDISKQLNIPVYFNPDSNSTQLDAKHGMEKNNSTPALYLASSQKAAKGRFERMLNMAWKRITRRLHFTWHQVKRQPKDDLNVTSLPVHKVVST